MGDSLVPRLSLSFSHFCTRANIIRYTTKERESLVRNRAHPWPFRPWFGMNLIMWVPFAHARARVDVDVRRPLPDSKASLTSNSCI